MPVPTWFMAISSELKHLWRRGDKPEPGKKPETEAKHKLHVWESLKPAELQLQLLLCHLWK